MTVGVLKMGLEGFPQKYYDVLKGSDVSADSSDLVVVVVSAGNAEVRRTESGIRKGVASSH
jgi:hypothetical protein